MTQALITQAGSPAVTANHTALWGREQIDVIKETVAKGASDAQLFMFLELAARYGLDPFAKEIWCANMGGGLTVMVSRDGYLKAAQRDPNFKGLKSFVVKEGDHFEIDAVNDTVIHKFGDKRGSILGAWAMAYHADRPPVIVWAEFSEYRKSNNIWSTYPSAMIQKVAEVMALKRQFGINGLVSQEEIGTPDEQPAYSGGPTLDAAHGEAPRTSTREGASTPPKSVNSHGLSEAQLKRLFAIARQNGMDPQAVKTLMRDHWGLESTKDLNRTQYDELCDRIIPEVDKAAETIEAEYTELDAEPGDKPPF